MTLGKLRSYTRLMRTANAALGIQAQTIDRLERELARTHLEYNREMQSLVCSWLISLESPEIDMRRDLARLDRALGNRVAELEEHVL